MNKREARRQAYGEFTVLQLRQMIAERVNVLAATPDEPCRVNEGILARDACGIFERALAKHPPEHVLNGNKRPRDLLLVTNILRECT